MMVWRQTDAATITFPRQFRRVAIKGLSRGIKRKPDSHRRSAPKASAPYPLTSDLWHLVTSCSTLHMALMSQYLSKARDKRCLGQVGPNSWLVPDGARR